MKVVVRSFGSTYGKMECEGGRVKFITVRGINTKIGDEKFLAEMTGLDFSVASRVLDHPKAVIALDKAWEFYWRGKREDWSDLQVIFRCFHGKHRSVALAEEFAKELKVSGECFDVEVIHRDQSHWFE